MIEASAAILALVSLAIFAALAAQWPATKRMMRIVSAGS